MIHDGFLPCAGCGRTSFLIRNLCKGCDPGRHRKWEERLERYMNAAVEYRRATGREPLEDFDAFNEWAAANGMAANEATDAR